MELSPDPLPEAGHPQVGGTARLRGEYTNEEPCQAPGNPARCRAEFRRDYKRDDGNRQIQHEAHDGLAGQDGIGRRIFHSLPIEGRYDRCTRRQIGAPPNTSKTYL